MNKDNIREKIDNSLCSSIIRINYFVNYDTMYGIIGRRIGWSRKIISTYLENFTK